MSKSGQIRTGRAGGGRGAFVTNGVVSTTFDQTRRSGIRVVLAPGSRVARGAQRPDDVPTVVPPRRVRDGGS